MHQSSLDIVIPSFRVDENIIRQVLALWAPSDFSIAVYLVIDNPKACISDELRRHPAVTIFINERNLGPSESRNRGIKAGSGEWILFLDDDVIPEKGLIHGYAQAIRANPDALGFAGVIEFPLPINAATKALTINGTISHFESARYSATLPWAPTANVILKRNYLPADLFDPKLIAGEDIDLLVRAGLLSEKRYICAPEAVVNHPWWNDGKVQTRRMFSYGRGSSQIAIKQPIKQYTYIDFTNTVETLALAVAFSPLAIFFERKVWLLGFAVALLLAEFLTSYFKVIIAGKTSSLLVAANLMWIKNCYEAGALFQTLVSGRLDGFARRIDTGFNKLHPSHFRTNRWKIIKLTLLGLMVLVGAIALRTTK